MTNKRKTEVVDDGEAPEIDLQTLLQHSQVLDQKLLEDDEHNARESAKHDFGLVDPSEVKGSAKTNHKAEEKLKAEIERLTGELAEAKTIIEDLNSTINDRDEQIQRLGQQLEAAAQAPVEQTEQIEETVTKEASAPAAPKAPWEPKE